MQNKIDKLAYRTIKPYRNFKTAVYSRAFETLKMKDPEYLKTSWNAVSKHLPVDKIYLETHRDLVIVDKDTIEMLKRFFRERGVETAAGITLTVNEAANFQTFDYENPEHRSKVKEIIEHTASLFDEIILDDFFFTNSKSHYNIKAKGEKRWSQYRLELMTEAAESLIIKPAKVINPKCRMIIKYPNWYEHFHGLGFNIQEGPSQFDGIYTGTETRDSSDAQHLPEYHSYSIFRYFENLKPDGNGGGWVDTGGSKYLDRYAEQLWLTLFAKAPEITLFDIYQLQRPIKSKQRGSWQDSDNISFSFDTLNIPARSIRSQTPPESIHNFAGAAGYALEIADNYLDKLGSPVGVNVYRPYHSHGEENLCGLLGMVGIPLNIVPEYTSESKNGLLTEQSSFDPDIIEKIKTSLLAGNSVTITSGFLNKKEKELADIAEWRYTKQKALINTIAEGFTGKRIDKISHERGILIPQIKYFTNDSWEIVSGLDGSNGWPLLLRSDYASGSLYLLTVPENPVDLLKLPSSTLSALKHFLVKPLGIMLEASPRVSLFLYDNNTAIIESFRDEPVEIRLRCNKKFTHLSDFPQGKNYPCSEFPIQEGGWLDKPVIYHDFCLRIEPHSFRVLKLK